MMSIEILDVTLIVPKLKHSTIFQKFDKLEAGTSFIIHNNHDPKPLYYQLVSERGEIFKWEYLKEGPEWWDVKISKNSLSKSEITIGEIVAKDFRNIQVFKKYEIDFCCGGDKTLASVCNDYGLPLSEIEAELADYKTEKVAGVFDYYSWNLDFLVDYIINIHHHYVTSKIDLINDLAKKVLSVHGDIHPELLKVFGLFSHIYNVLPNHLKAEEETIFPYIKNLVQMSKANYNISELESVTIVQSLEIIKNEHTEIGIEFKEIRKLSNNFTPPEDACNSYSYLYSMMHEFEEDLHQHIHLENNILFPKAINLEKELSSKQF